MLDKEYLKGTELPELLYYCGEPIDKEMSKEKLLEIIKVSRQDLNAEVETNNRSRRMDKLFGRAISLLKLSHFQRIQDYA